MTDASATPQITCPACGKHYKWKAQFAGRKVLCKCGAKLRMPTHPQGQPQLLDSPAAPPPKPQKPTPPPTSPAPENNIYDLAIPQEEQPPSLAVEPVGGKCPSCNAKLKPNAIICINCGFNLEVGKKLKTKIAAPLADEPTPANNRPNNPPDAAKPTNLAAMIGGTSPIVTALDERADEAKENPFIELWLPLALIVIGMAVQLVQTVYFSKSVGNNATTGLIAGSISLAIQLAIAIPLMLFAMVLATRILGVAFGTLTRALLKLMAIVLGPSALVSIGVYFLGGELPFVVLGWFVAFAIYWALISILFDLEGMDALYVMAIIWVVNYAGTVLLAMVLSLFMF